MIRIILVGVSGEDLGFFLSMASGSESLSVVGSFPHGQEAADYLVPIGDGWKGVADQVVCEDISDGIGGVSLLTTLRERGIEIPFLFCPVADLVRYL